MSGKDLLVVLGDIDERFIDEAENRTFSGPAYGRMASLAACLCLVLLSFFSLRPLLGGPHGPVSPTTEPVETFLPEGFPAVIAYVEEMTEDGFTARVTEIVTPGIFEAGMKLNVRIDEDTLYIAAEGSSMNIQNNALDCSGRYFLIECGDYDPDAAVVTAFCIMELQPPETTP